MATQDERIAARRRALEAAVASNRLEGHEPDPAFADLHEARISGQLGHGAAMDEMVRRVLGPARPEPGL